MNQLLCEYCKLYLKTYIKLMAFVCIHAAVTGEYFNTQSPLKHHNLCFMQFGVFSFQCCGQEHLMWVLKSMVVAHNQSHLQWKECIL